MIFVFFVPFVVQSLWQTWCNLCGGRKFTTKDTKFTKGDFAKIWLLLGRRGLGEMS